MKNKPGRKKMAPEDRKPETRPVSFRVPKYVWEAIQNAAERTKETPSQVIARVVRDALSDSGDIP